MDAGSLLEGLWALYSFSLSQQRFLGNEYGCPLFFLAELLCPFTAVWQADFQQADFLGIGPLWQQEHLLLNSWIHSCWKHRSLLGRKGWFPIYLAKLDLHDQGQHMTETYRGQLSSLEPAGGLPGGIWLETRCWIRWIFVVWAIRISAGIFLCSVAVLVIKVEQSLNRQPNRNRLVKWTSRPFTFWDGWIKSYQAQGF